jgi:hypothetical protein
VVVSMAFRWVTSNVGVSMCRSCQTTRIFCLTGGVIWDCQLGAKGNSRTNAVFHLLELKT